MFEEDPNNSFTVAGILAETMIAKGSLRLFVKKHLQINS